MTKWKKDATEFTVNVARRNERMSNTACIPKPVMDFLGDPEALRFKIKNNRFIVLEAGD